MDRIETKLKLLKPLLPAAQWEFFRYQYVLATDHIQRTQAEATIDLLISKLIPGLLSEQILLPPPDKSLLTGEYPIGPVLYPSQPIGQFSIRAEEWLRHCGIFGKTGSGKTTLTINILKTLCEQNHPFLIFDYKRNYRDLLKHPDFKDENIRIYTVGRNDVVPFYFNPKITPEGVEAYVWIKQLAQIIEKVYLLGPGANDVFMESADYKTFGEMHENILKQKKRARELLWWASAKRTLNAINYPGLGEMVNCQQGHRIDQILKQKVILELDGLSGSDQAFVIGTLLLWIYHYRMRQPEREILKHFIIVEEAHHLFLKTRMEEDIADVIMREIRELGEAMIIIDQHPSKMSVSALGNLSTKFVLGMSLNQDVLSLANSMLLENQQKQYLAMLKVGQTICRSDRFPNPILISVPYTKVHKGVVGDQDIKAYMKPYLLDAQPENPGKPNISDIQGIPKEETLSPLAKILLDHLAAKPFIGLVKRFKDLGLKVAHGYQVIDELVSLNMIKPVTIDGRRLYELTESARRLSGKNRSQKGRGGLEHQYYLRKIYNYFIQKNCKVWIEKDDLDLVVACKNKRIAIQLETGKSNITHNLKKLDTYPADQKYMIATNRNAEILIKQLKKSLKMASMETIHVSYVKDFLRESL